MEKLTPDNLMTFAIVLLGLASALAVLAKAVEIVKGWFKPQRDIRDQLKKHEEMFARDSRRLDKHESELEGLKEGQRYLCAGVQVLIEHELHNGNTEEMKAASSSISTWLLSK